MKCLEGYTIEQVKEMSPEELLVLWNAILREKQANEIMSTIVEMLEVMEAKRPMIEN